MLKHRDTDNLNNRIERFVGQKYSFVGLVNSDSKGKEVWSGLNEKGFAIMNTATYDLKDDDVPDSMMDKEGIVMYRALEVCSTLSDFETLLDTLTRPMGVETNFGVIDAWGGAAYYEVNNHSWTKFDVNSIPVGYMVVTNFTRTGRKEDRKGVDRFEKASQIMQGADLKHISHEFLFNGISRSGKPILRDITSASLVFEGVKVGEDPLHSVMWTLLGYPASTVSVPIFVMDEDHIHPMMKSSTASVNSKLCDNALRLKGKDVSQAVSATEQYSESLFSPLISKYRGGAVTHKRFSRLYDRYCDKVFKRYGENFLKYLP